MDVLRLRKLAVRNSGHHAERREHCRPDCGATSLNDLHHIPEEPSKKPGVRQRPLTGSTQARKQDDFQQREKIALTFSVSCGKWDVEQSLTFAWVVKFQT